MSATSTDFGFDLHRSPPSTVELYVENGTSTANSAFGDKRAVLTIFPCAVSTVTLTSIPFALFGKLLTVPSTVILAVTHLEDMLVPQIPIITSKTSNRCSFFIVAPWACIQNMTFRSGPVGRQDHNPNREPLHGLVLKQVNNTPQEQRPQVRGQTCGAIHSL